MADPSTTAPRIVRLRIAGFKSFAEPATIEIPPGLTGVVGPNGCGKSNVTEALRWAMGEANARTLRGGEMDDVIFAGTATRPSRNLAEVVLTLEDHDGVGFPPPFTGLPELQVARRIERGTGSSFRVNGREARARDIQTLFADLASGARSSGLVSQGRVAAIVAARPDERRQVLEEAAGITGLHTRRAEAEGKLRGAEQNLERAEEQRAGLEAQLTSLRRQAVEAGHFRSAAVAVRDAEAAFLALVLARAQAARLHAALAQDAARQAVLQASSAANAAETESARAAAARPALREREAAARIALEHARTAQQALAADAARARDALAAATARRAQLAQDLAYATRVQQDVRAADARLASEAERLSNDAASAPAQFEAARAAAAAAAAAVEAADAAATQATERAATLAASTQTLAALLDQAASRARRAADTLARLHADRARAAAQSIDPTRLAAARHEHATADAALAQACDHLDSAERARATGATGATAARDAANRAEAARSGLAAEAGALAEVAAIRDNESWPPLLDLLCVPPGLEAALGAALGEDLAAAANPDAARHWRDLPGVAALPSFAEPLAAVVRGPAALSRALGAVGIVPDDATGDTGQAGLLPGQSLVSLAGAMWRWDGYTMRAGTPSATTVRLQQRNRLVMLQSRLADATDAADTARLAHSAASAVERDEAAAEAKARLTRRGAEQRADRSRQAAVALETQAAAVIARLAGLDDQIAAVQPEATDAAAALAIAQAQRAALSDSAGLRIESDHARAALSAARGRDIAAARVLDGLSRDDAARTARGRILVRERDDGRMRAADAAGRVTDLTARTAQADAEHAALAATPQQAPEQADTLGPAEAAHHAATRILDAADRHADASAQAARGAEQALAAAREALVRAEGANTAANASHQAALERIQQRLPGYATLPPPSTDLSQANEARARARCDRLVRERDAIGPVNLRAEIEAAAVSEAAERVQRDRDELAAAIAKLRGSIGHLNREGRERLATIFQQVDRHFQALFARMFGGGRAHLALVGSDDPLAAGLEIYAQPPGKKLTALSLLSGGEQALTALSLIFAVFRCNPAPLCVLDEVDAPLDDANVDRFCTLLTDTVRDTGTRFLIVTHHQLTMARMDRLYGVTMQERGVSRLLSVDLGAAVAMVDAVAAE